MKTKGISILIAAGIVLAIVLANLAASYRQSISGQAMLEQFYPPSAFVTERVNDNKWMLFDHNGNAEGVVYLGEGRGYNGIVRVMVHAGEQGEILQLKVYEHNETPSYFQKITQSAFLAKFTGRPLATLHEKPDFAEAVSGATVTSRAIIQGAGHAYAEGERMNLKRSRPAFAFPVLLVSLLLLFGTLLKYIKNVRFKKFMWWLSLLFSLVFVGFIHNYSLTLSRFASLLSGYLPDPASELSMYILIFGSILLILLLRRNVYCQSVCPFGAAQELLGAIGNAKPYRPCWHKKWKWLQWSAAGVVLLAAIALKDPSLTQYEVFGAFFQLTGSTLMFALLLVVVILSVFIKRPWCHFVCPLDGVFAFFRLLRRIFDQEHNQGPAMGKGCKPSPIREM